MVVNAGFGGAARVGTWVPVTVDLANEGSDVSGELQIEVQDTRARGIFSRPPTVYSVPVQLPRLSQKRYRLEVVFPLFSNRVQARLVSAGEVLLEQEVTFRRVPLGEFLCGVVARNPDGLAFLAAVELPGPHRGVRPVALDLASLPATAQLYSSMDCLIFDDVATSALSQAQKEALEVWVSGGGLLVLVGGPAWQKTIGPLPEGLSPVRITGTAELPSLSAFAAFARQPFRDSRPVLASRAISTGGSALVEQDGVPLLVVQRKGEGALVYLAADPAEPPLRGWAGAPFLWRQILSYASVETGIGSSIIRPQMRWGRVPSLGISDLTTLPEPSATWLVALMLIFGLTLGPAHFFLLAWAGRPALGLVTTPLLVLLASSVSLAIALAQRQGEAVLVETTLLRTQAGQATGYARTYVGLFARHSGEYRLQLPRSGLASALFFPLPRGSDASPAWKLQIDQSGEPSIRALALKAGELGTFAVDGHTRLRSPIKAELRTDGEAIYGRISNEGEDTLAQAVLLHYGKVSPLGDLKAGGTREIDLRAPAFAPAGYGLPENLASSLVPSEPGPEQPLTRIRRETVERMVTSRWYFSRMELGGLNLLGWSRERPLSVAPAGARTDRIVHTLVLADLPLRLESGFDGSVSSGVMSRKHLSASTFARQEADTYQLSPSEPLAVQYRLPVGDQGFQVQRMELNLVGNIQGRGLSDIPLGWAGLAHVYNWRRADWEAFDIGWGANPLPRPHEFLSATGEVRLRYGLETAGPSGPMQVSVQRFDVTVWGKAL